MIVRRVLKIALAALFLSPVLPAFAGAPGGLGAGHGIYLGDSQILDAEPMHQLTVRENVREYQFSPSGEKIAYVVSVEDHGERYFAVKVVDTWRSEPEAKTLTRQANPLTAEEWETPLLSLLGWAGDDRYLLLSRTVVTVTDEGPTYSPQMEILDLSAKSPEPLLIPMEAPEKKGAIVGLSYAWAPARDRLLIGKNILDFSEKSTRDENSYFLFDPLTGKLQPLAINAPDTVLGWLDDSHLLLRSKVGKKQTYRQYDPASGLIADSARPDWWGQRPELELFSQHSPSGETNPKDPSLALDLGRHGLPDSRKDDETSATTIWVLHDPPGKKLSALPVGVTPGYDLPQEQWSPTGKAVAFIAHGDVFLTRLIKRLASSREKLTAGEPLTCEEEKQIAMSNLKQIGLGIMQYVQDNDEKYPSASKFPGDVIPYFQDTSLLSMGNRQFEYHAPVDPSLAHMDAPADVILGEITTSCARIVLYADGHVKALDK